jgi:acyl carrier protein
MSTDADRIVALFRDQLNVDVTDIDTDLINAGLMDSLMLVDLLTFLEQEYQITIDLVDLDMSHFSSIGSIARFVEAHKPTEPKPTP